MNVLSVFSGLFAVNINKEYAQANGLKNESYLVLLGSIAAIFNALRGIWSFATDYLPYRLVYGVLLVLQMTLNFTITLVNKNPFFYGLWISLMVSCEGGHLTLLPNVAKKIYGDDYGTQAYGVLFTY